MKWTDLSPATAMPVAPPALRALPSPRSLCIGSATRSAAVDVQIAASVHEQVLTHLRTEPQELGGLLLGLAWGRADDPEQAALITVLDAVAAADSSGNGYSLRMEAAVWSAANAQLAVLQTQAPAARIVGWYHSHPGLGAFFSHTDCMTQAACFAHPYSIGWVIDPSDDTHACFVGADSRPVRGLALMDADSAELIAAAAA